MTLALAAILNELISYGDPALVRWSSISVAAATDEIAKSLTAEVIERLDIFSLASAAPCAIELPNPAHFSLIKDEAVSACFFIASSIIIKLFQHN